MLTVRALPPFYCFAILFITIPSFLLLLNTAQNKKQSFAYGYWFGFGYFSCNLSWIGNALLLDAANLGWLYPITLIASGGFFGLFIGFPALLSNCFKPLYCRWLSFSAWWVIFEWIRSFILTGFPWNLLGSVLSFNEVLIQTASEIGTYGLSLIVLLTTGSLCLIAFYKNKNSLIVSIITIIMLYGSMYAYGTKRLSEISQEKSDIKIRIVQPAIPQTMKWNRQNLEENLEKYIKLSQRPGINDIDFVIWGETATPFALDFEPQYIKDITQAIPTQGYLITGLVRYVLQGGDFHPKNSMYVINKGGSILDFYDKSHLVPFGEYIPFRTYLPQWISPITNTINDFVAGDGLKAIKISNYPSFGVLICYEIIFPHEIINPKARPEWLINLTNDGWYGESQGPYQHMVTTQLRAIEEGRTIVRAANTGISGVINPYGQILGQIPLNQSNILDIDLPKELYKDTNYGQYGNIIPLILCFINIGIAFAIKNKKS